MAKKSSGSKDWDDLSVGDQVKHDKWNVGTVLHRSGSGDTAKAVVVFPEEGQKKLMLKYAGLTKVGSATKSEMAAMSKAAEKEKPKRRPSKPKPTVVVPDEDDSDAANLDLFDEDEEHQFDKAAKDDGDDD